MIRIDWDFSARANELLGHSIKPLSWRAPLLLHYVDNSMVYRTNWVSLTVKYWEIVAGVYGLLSLVMFVF